MKPEAPSYQLRLATDDDIDAIIALSRPFVAQQTLLPRTRATLAPYLSTTWVMEYRNTIVGANSLVFFNARLCEIRGLVVDTGMQGFGLGRELLKTGVEYVSQYCSLPVRLFALTYDPSFFEKVGFVITDKNNFPEKIYEVCQFCARKHDCREIAVQRWITETK